MVQSKQKAIILGGTNAHIPLIQNLKQRGYYTILADYLEAPPSKSYADEHLLESSLDQDGILDLARSRQASLVISTSVDQANVTVCYVAEQLGLPAPYSFETASLIANKTSMKQRFIEYGVPTAKYEVINNPASLNDVQIDKPMVVKPVDCGGSKAVRKVSNHQELLNAGKEAFDASKSQEIIVEEFCEGIEFSADCFILEGKAHLLMIREKHIHKSENNTVLCSYASVSPPVNLSQTVYNRIENVVQKIADGFHLKTTSLLLQFIVHGEDIYVLEFAPRIGGGLGSRAIFHQTGFDIVEATINSYFGINSEVKIKENPGYLCAHHIYADSGVFGSIENHQTLIENQFIEEFYIHKSKGNLIGESFSSSDRPASFIAKAKDYPTLLANVEHIFNLLKIYDDKGNDVLRRDIRLGFK